MQFFRLKDRYGTVNVHTIYFHSKRTILKTIKIII